MKSKSAVGRNQRALKWNRRPRIVGRPMELIVVCQLHTCELHDLMRVSDTMRDCVQESSHHCCRELLDMTRFTQPCFIKLLNDVDRFRNRLLNG